jgi:predicted permease
MSSIAQDVRYAFRALGKAPGFTALAVATLAIGIGANTTIFSAVRAVLLRPLPFPEPERLVQAYTLTRGDSGTSFSPPDFTDLRAGNTTLLGLAATFQSSFALTDVGEAEQVTAAVVSGDFFGVMGVPPLHGRTLQVADDVEGGPRVVVLSWQFWARRFGSDRDFVGRSIRLDGESYQVTGVMPRGFSYPSKPDLWVPTAFSANQLANLRGAHWLDVVGRLRDGVSLERAQGEFRTIGDRLAQQYPNTNANTSATLVPLHAAITGDARPAMRSLFGAVALVLALVCANVANLLLARGIGRGRDIAIRTALGASPRRIARGLMVESLVLAGVGGGVGLLIAAWGASAIAGLSGTGVPFLDQTRLDGAVLTFGLAVTVLTGLLFGAIPAWDAVRSPDLTRHLKSEGGSVTADVRRRRLRRALVVGEIALATALLAGAGVMIKSLGRLLAVDLGLETRGVLTFGMNLPNASYPTPERRAQFAEELTARLARLSGTTRVSLVFGLPLTGFSYAISGLTIDGRELSLEEQNRTTVQVRVVTPDYFTTLGIPVRSGRAFNDNDRLSSAPVIIVNEAAAELLWPGTQALGHQFTIGTRLGKTADRVGGEVVGVVADMRDRGPSRPARPTLFAPYGQRPVSFVSVVVRTQGAPDALVQPARAVVAELDGSLPIFRVRPLEQIAGDAVAQPLLYAVLLTLFAGTALLLAVIGVYGVMSFSVARRARDIGVRIALGATPGGVLRLVLSEGARITAVGLAAGVFAAWAATRVLEQQLFEVKPADPATFVVVTAVLGAVAVLACYIPARRATKIDPLTAIRSE